MIGLTHKLLRFADKVDVENVSHKSSGSVAGDGKL